jgi:toxin ParE1/3/4
MNTFTLTRRAKSDLKAIAKFTEKRWGKAQRNIYIKQFDTTFHLLSDTPRAGKSCDFIMKDYLKSPQGSHIIFYKTASDNTVEIVRILHKNMDVTSGLEGS